MLDLAQATWRGGGLDSGAPIAIRDQPVCEFAGPALDRALHRVIKRGRGLAEADDRMRHEVRKDAKKLRYAAGFFAALFDRKRGRRRYKQFTQALERLQDELGALTDQATAPDVLAKLGIDAPKGALDSLFPGSKSELLAAAEDSWDRLRETARFWR